MNRPFTDLIKEIEVNGEKFVPIVKLAAFAFALTEQPTELSSFLDGQRSCWHTFAAPQFSQPRAIQVRRNFDIICYRVITGINITNSDGVLPTGHQVKLFNLLKEWNFID